MFLVFYSFRSDCATKASAGLSGSQARSGLEIESIEMGKSWDVREH